MSWAVPTKMEYEFCLRIGVGQVFSAIDFETMFNIEHKKVGVGLTPLLRKKIIKPIYRDKLNGKWITFFERIR